MSCENVRKAAGKVDTSLKANDESFREILDSEFLFFDCRFASIAYVRYSVCLRTYHLYCPTLICVNGIVCSLVDAYKKAHEKCSHTHLVKTIDESLHGGIHRGYRPGGFVLGLGRAIGGAGIAAAATRRRGWPGR